MMRWQALLCFSSLALLFSACSPEGGGRASKSNDAIGGSDATGSAATGDTGADDLTGTDDTGTATADTGAATTDTGGAETTGGDTTGGDTTGGDTTGGDPTGGDPPAQVDPSCIDGQYKETLPPKDADISGLISSFSPAAFQQFVLDVLEVRYPIGYYLVNMAKGQGVNGTSQNCIEFFLQTYGTGSASSVLKGIGTVVHECGHTADLLDLFNQQMIINQSLAFSCKGGGAPPSGQTFAASLLKGDEYAPLYAPCATFGGGGDCDFYGTTYLSGDSTDGTFDMGDQGFSMVLEETTQYVNSLAVAYAFHDQKGGFGASDRDGILTFLWYVTRYLRMARTQKPGVYSLLSKDKCWRDAILTIWGRAWLYLKATEGMSGMGINDKKIEKLVMDPDLLNEIQLLRDLAGC